MIVAHVVPLRRLPIERQFFDYLVPAELALQIGQVVEIPFGRRLLLGIIWTISDQSEIQSLKSITRILRPEPVITDWQHHLIGLMAEWYFVSLGHLVDSTVPDYPKRLIDEPPLPLPSGRFRRPPVQHERVWWYRDRRQNMEQSLDWLLKDDAARVICVPTVDDIEDYRRLLGADTKYVAFVDSQLGLRDYRLLYEQVRCGVIKKVVGTGRGLLLPWQQAPSILLDQEEHPAHRQTEQHPRLDNRQTIELVAPQAIVTSPAPTVHVMHTRHPQPPVFRGQRQLAVLGQPGSRDWLTPDAEQLINDTLGHGQSILTIVPHHGFAQRVACRECGWTVVCTNCGRRVRLLQRSTTVAQCQACNASVDVPAICPRCQAVSWSLSGLGVEQFMENLHRRWPKGRITRADGDLGRGPSMIVGTYQSYRLRRAQLPICPALVVSGDALLSYPDYSVNERAWAYLGRLQSEQPGSLVMVQTYEPSLPFWQRWRHGDDRSWYDDELHQRTTLALPPMADQWIARYPTGGVATVEAKRQELLRVAPPGVTVIRMSEHQSSRWRHRPAGRLLIQAPIGVPLRSAFPWMKLFPTPWQLDPSIRGWTE